MMENNKDVKKTGWSILKAKADDILTDETERENGESKEETLENAGPKNIFQPSVPKDVKLSTISEDVMITGDIKAAGNIEVFGTVIGNVECGDLIIKNSGKIEGDVTSRDLTVLSKEFKGNITCSKNVTIDKEAVIYGDVNAENVTCEGKVNGNVNVSQFLDLKATAVINGNCTLDTIAIEKGGMINGSLKNHK